MDFSHCPGGVIELGDHPEIYTYSPGFDSRHKVLFYDQEPIIPSIPSVTLKSLIIQMVIL